MRVLGKHVFIRRDEPDKTTRGGIAIPETSWYWRPHGVVVHIGHTVEAVAPGDRVIFLAHQGAWFVVEGERLWGLTEDGILARIEG
jgi:co-chaperonin GroES (HSP10)